MDFEPQTASQPRINPYKGSKVNFAILAGVVVFLIISLNCAWRLSRSTSSEPPIPPEATGGP